MRKNLKAVWIALLVVPTATFGGSALAAEPDWTAAAKTFEEAKASGDGPTSEAEYGQCSAVWSVWVDKVMNEKKLPHAGRVLGEDLTGENSRIYALQWIMSIDEEGPAEDARVAADPKARNLIDKALTGDDEALIALTGTLGICTKFPE